MLLHPLFGTKHVGLLGAFLLFALELGPMCGRVLLGSTHSVVGIWVELLIALLGDNFLLLGCLMRQL